MAHQSPTSRIKDILIRITDTSNQDINPSNIFLDPLRRSPNIIPVYQIASISINR